MNRGSTRTEESLIFAVTLALLTLTFLSLAKITDVPISSITGDVTSTVNVLEFRIVPCQFTLEEGFNLVSFFCIPNGVSRSDVVSNITNLISIFEYQEGQADKWKSYNPNLPSYVVQDLNTMFRSEGYWVNMGASESVNITGGIRAPTSIGLAPGWNLAGYPTNRSKPVNESFESIAGNYTEVRAYNTTQGVYIFHIPPSTGTLTDTEPYRGYWINATTNEVWVVEQ